MLSRIFFEDRGQDYLQWVVMADGRIIDSQPFQGELWTGHTVADMESLKPGEKVVTIRNKDKKPCTNKHNVLIVETIEDFTDLTSAEAVVHINLAVVKGMSIDDLWANLLAEKAEKNRSSLVNFIEEKIKLLTKKEVNDG